MYVKNINMSKEYISNYVYLNHDFPKKNIVVDDID